MAKYNLEISHDNETPRHIYLLQIDPSLNQNTNETHPLPIQFLNNSSDYSPGQFLVPLQTLEGQDQLETLLDNQQLSEVKYINQQHETGKNLQKLILDSCLSKTLQSGELKQISEVETYSESATDLSNHLDDTACKKQLICNYIHIPDRSVLPRAFAVIPSVLQIRLKDVIAPKRTLPACTRFGPIVGIRKKMIANTDVLNNSTASDKTPMFILKDENHTTTYIDVSDKDKSNWIGLLPLGDENTANLWIYEDNSELYIITTEAIPSRKQLMLGYSKQYAQDYGITGPVKDIHTECLLNVKSWRCYECDRTLSSAIQLQRHMNAYHEGSGVIKRRRYRCRNCIRTFSRIFALRRHMARHCNKKTDESVKPVIKETPPEACLNSSLNIEDNNRVPSDESFQNYSTSLDFSTNLFDTDRISGLDISGNSRSELFNPYVLEGENVLTNYLEFKNGGLDKCDDAPTCDNEKSDKKVTETVPVPCPYCNQDIAKGKRRRHIRECPGRRFECDCKKVFTSKEQLANHIYTQHSKEREAEEEKVEKIMSDTCTNTVDDSKAYKCEQCEYSFKRRGMLINHLWRKHDTISTQVPLNRRVRHYPCVACPKVYRTATKRNIHVQRHHPEVDRLSQLSWCVEGGTREAEPAVCPACPRQYATRAKMLQHLRQHHTNVATIPENEIFSEKNAVRNIDTVLNLTSDVTRRRRF